MPLPQQAGAVVVMSAWDLTLVDSEARRSTILQKRDHKHSKSDKMRRQRSMLLLKEQDKSLQEQLNEEETGNLPEKELRIIIVKITQDLRRRMEAQTEKIQEIFDQEMEDLKNKQN